MVAEVAYSLTGTIFEGKPIDRSPRANGTSTHTDESKKTKVIPFRPRDEEPISTDSNDLESQTNFTEGVLARVKENIASEAEASSVEDSSPEPSRDFLEIIRMHFLNPIIDAFDELQSYAESPNAAVYINEILHLIKEIEARSPQDPYLNILMALYDALAFNNNWTQYDQDQLKGAKDTLVKYSKRNALNQRTVEKAIIELEVLGFDTTPFVFNFESEAE